MKACLALLALVAMATSASAAKLVVIAMDSGRTPTTATGLPLGGTAPPVQPAGAKGFLIGIDNTHQGALEMADGVLNPLAYQLSFSGPGLVQREALIGFGDGDLPSPTVNTRSEGAAANLTDGAPLAPSRFESNDSWWWFDAQQGAAPDLRKLIPTGTGIAGGAPNGPMNMAGAWVIPTAGDPIFATTPRQDNWRFAYIVAHGDVNINGVLASGQFGYDLVGGSISTTQTFAGFLDFETGQFQLIPEPSTLVLAALGLVGMGVGAWRRRK